MLRTGGKGAGVRTMTIDLMQFCERNAMRLWMAEPFGIGEYTYARSARNATAKA